MAAKATATDRGVRVRSRAIAVLSAAVIALSSLAGTALAAKPPGPAPDVTAVDPDRGEVGDAIVVTGRDFGGPRTRVWVGGVAALVTSSTGSRAMFVVPTGAPVGVTTVRVANPSGQSDSIAFTVLGWDGNLTLQADTGAAVTAMIGRGGGALESGALRLDIPAGALSEDTAITMTPLLGVSGSPFDADFIGGAHFAPEGLLFLSPASLSIPLPSGMWAASVLGLGASGWGTGVHLLPRRIFDDRIVVDVWHFSAVSATSGGEVVADIVATFPPTIAEAAALNALAAAAAACAIEQGPGPDYVTDGPACLAQEGIYEAALRTWYETSVLPHLQSSEGAWYPFDQAFAEWLRWSARVQEFGVHDALVAETQAARAAAEVALRAELVRRLQRCTGSDLQEEFHHVGQLTPFAVQGAFLDSPGMAPDGRILPAAGGDGYLWACAHLSVAALDLPPVVARETTTTLTGQASLDVWEGPNRTDSELGLSLAFSPLGATMVNPPSEPGVGGQFQSDLRIDPATSSVKVSVTVTSSAVALVVLGLGSASSEIIRPAADRISLSPGDTTIDPSTHHELTARLAGEGIDGQTLQFSLSGPGSLSSTSGVTDSNGEVLVTFMAPATAGQATVTATLTEDGHTFMSSNVLTIQADVSVSIDPTIVVLETNSQQQFTALVSNAGDPTVTWAATCGTVAGGLYIAPASPTDCVVTATSVEDSLASASASVTVVEAAPAQAWFDGRVLAYETNSGQTEGDEILLSPWPSSRVDWRAFETTSSSGSTGSDGAGSYSVTSRASQVVTPTFVDGFLRTLDVVTAAQVDTAASGCAEGDSLCVANGHARSEYSFTFDVGQTSTVQLTGTLTAIESAVTSNDRVCRVNFFGVADAVPDYVVTCGFDGTGVFNVSFSGTLSPGRYRLDVLTIATSNSYSFRSSGSASSGSNLHVEVTPQ
ncbi:MAG: IPT/TIG domain-containing protein [Chloroflexota bacterium]